MDNDGGRAFPSDEYNVNFGHDSGRYEICQQHPGMSLRDWFAGQALNGWAAGRNGPATFEIDSNPRAVASACYRYADAMLEARKAVPIG